VAIAIGIRCGAIPIFRGRGDPYTNRKWLTPIVQHEAQIGETSIRAVVVGRRTVKEAARTGNRIKPGSNVSV
jgi:hypothetical protein